MLLRDNCNTERGSSSWEFRGPLFLPRNVSRVAQTHIRAAVRLWYAGPRELSLENPWQGDDNLYCLVDDNPFHRKRWRVDEYDLNDVVTNVCSHVKGVGITLLPSIDCAPYTLRTFFVTAEAHVGSPG